MVFTCFSSRVIYIEVLEVMDVSVFICVLRRFFALRGYVKFFRCDRGINFIGVKIEFGEVVSEFNDKKVEKFVTEYGCKWEFNFFYVLYFGGVWER